MAHEAEEEGGEDAVGGAEEEAAVGGEEAGVEGGGGDGEVGEGEEGECEAEVEEEEAEEGEEDGVHYCCCCWLERETVGVGGVEGWKGGEFCALWASWFINECCWGRGGGIERCKGILGGSLGLRSVTPC